MTQIVSTAQSADPTGTFGNDILPDFKNVVGQWKFGGSEASSLLNRITGVAATKIGQPDWQAGYAVMGYGGGTGTNGITTDVSCPATSSLVMVVRLPVASNPAIAGIAGEFNNFNMVLPSRTQYSCGNGQTYGPSLQSMVALPADGGGYTYSPDRFALIMGVGAIATPSRAYLRTASGTIVNDGLAQYLPDHRAAGLLQIGGLFNNQVGGNFHVSDVVLLNGAMGSTYLDKLYDRIAARLATNGLPIN